MSIYDNSTIRLATGLAMMGFAACASTQTAKPVAAHTIAAFARSNPGTAKARVSEVQTAHARFSYTHDQLGRLTNTSVVQRISGVHNFSSRYGYSGAPGASGPGNVVLERTGHDGAIVRYAYDSAGNRKSIHHGDRAILVSEKRDAAGRVRERHLGDGSVTTISYHADTKNPSDIFASRNGQTIVNLHYEYDARSNVRSLNDAATGATSYEYDSYNQLIATRGAEENSYKYDAIGNLVEMNGDRMEYSAAKPHAPRSFRGATFDYDARGNRTSDVRSGGPDQRIAWTHDNRVSTVARGGRVVFQKEYAGSLLWATLEYDSDGAERVVEHLPGVRIDNGDAREQIDGYAERMPDGSFRFFHSDHLGSLRATTNEAGVVLAQYAYGPYGNARAVSGSFDASRGFNGREHEASGYINYGARDYDPFTARWLSPDIVDRDGLNRYAYVRNNPMRYLDPSGHAAGDAIAGFVGYGKEFAQGLDQFGLAATLCVAGGECGQLGNAMVQGMASPVISLMAAGGDTLLAGYAAYKGNTKASDYHLGRAGAEFAAVALSFVGARGGGGFTQMNIGVKLAPRPNPAAGAHFPVAHIQGKNGANAYMIGRNWEGTQLHRQVTAFVDSQPRGTNVFAAHHEGGVAGAFADGANNPLPGGIQTVVDVIAAKPATRNNVLMMCHSGQCAAGSISTAFPGRGFAATNRPASSVGGRLTEVLPNGNHVNAGASGSTWRTFANGFTIVE